MSLIEHFSIGVVGGLMMGLSVFACVWPFSAGRKALRSVVGGRPSDF